MGYLTIDVPPIRLDRMPRRLAALMCVCVTALACACATGGPSTPAGVTGHRGPSHIRVKLGERGPVRSIALEEYVRGTVISEVAPDPAEGAAGERMLEVQAIIARTYAVAHLSRHGREGYDLCSTTHCQLYDPARLKTSFWSEHVAAASRRTSGVVLWYGSSPASAVFHADCGGHTSAARDVWGGEAHPYLAGTIDDGPANRAHRTWRFEAEHDVLAAALNADARTRVGTRLFNVTILRRDGAGRAASISLNGSQVPLVRGEELRAVLTPTFGARALRSTRFDVRRSGSRFVFEGRGFGHGVGLCQAGALARLRAGATPRQVLAKYYAGAKLVRLR